LIAHEVFQKGKPPTLIEYLASKVAGKLCSGKTYWFCYFQSYSGEYELFRITEEKAGISGILA
jgi:hypothetical protein